MTYRWRSARYRLILAGTVEERIVALHHQKRDLAFQLLSGTDRSAKMSVADMLALLEASDGTNCSSATG